MLNRRQKRFDDFVEKHRYDPSKDKKKDETNTTNEPSTNDD